MTTAPPAETIEPGVHFQRSGFAEPFDLVVDGTPVPHVTAHGDIVSHADGDYVTFVVDGRIGVEIPVEHSEKVARLVADAVAVASGYACHPRDGEPPVQRSPYDPRARLGERWDLPARSPLAV